MDLYNREIISYSISLSPHLWQIREMLDSLFKKLPADAKPLFHSDQGWQYQHLEYQRLLQEHNIVQSMSRKGIYMDNCAMENFFYRLKVEMFYNEEFESVNAFIDELKKIYRLLQLLQQRKNFYNKKADYTIGLKQNQLHWCLDVIFREDASRARKDNSPLNLNVLRKTALNLVFQAQYKRISKKRLMFRADLEPTLFLDILFDSSSVSPQKWMLLPCLVECKYALLPSSW